MKKKTWLSSTELADAIVSGSYWQNPDSNDAEIASLQAAVGLAISCMDVASLQKLSAHPEVVALLCIAKKHNLP